MIGPNSVSKIERFYFIIFFSSHDSGMEFMKGLKCRKMNYNFPIYFLNTKIKWSELYELRKTTELKSANSELCLSHIVEKV